VHAGLFEIWAARLWNVFNEGRPFSVVYPQLVLACALPLGLAPDGPYVAASGAALVFSLVSARYQFPLRGRALLWLAAIAGVALLEPWRAPGMLVGALGGYVFFTVVMWGTVYYRLRTGAPWTNFLRFWRLVLTNSDPTSGNALEQVPKLVLTLGAATTAALEPAAVAGPRIGLAAALVTALGAFWQRRFERRLPPYPVHMAAGTTPRSRLAERVYVIVVDGLNRERFWQAHAPHLDRLFRSGTEYLGVEPAYPARTVVCFSSMLTGATPAEHGMRSNFAPRLGVRCESLFDTLARAGMRGRLVGIAHLLDPFPGGEVSAVTSVQATAAIDRSLVAEGLRVVRDEDPELLVLQLLATDQIGHVRGVRNREYLEQLERSDALVGEFLAQLEALGKLDRATVIVMADHGQGRGIGGHGHLDWGERPVPFAIWGRGAVPGAVVRGRRSVLELAATVAALLGVPAPTAARGRPLVPQLEPPGAVEPALRGRALAVVPARNEEATIGAVLAAVPKQACGFELDLLVVDDGSTDATARIAREAGARVLAHGRGRGLGAALRSGLAVARDEDYDACVYLDADGEYDAREIPRLLDPIARRRADYVVGSRFLGRREGMAWHRALTNRIGSAVLGSLMGGRVVTDGQSGFRAFSKRALHAARIRHDYNYAQVLTLALWGAGIEPLEVPISWRRRSTGRSFVRYPEYLARVLPAVWREWRSSLAARKAARASAQPSASR